MIEKEEILKHIDPGTGLTLEELIDAFTSDPREAKRFKAYLSQNKTKYDTGGNLMNENKVRTNMFVASVMGSDTISNFRKIVDILEDSFEAGHNNESYTDRVEFAKFLISRGIIVAKE